MAPLLWQSGSASTHLFMKVGFPAKGVSKLCATYGCRWCCALSPYGWASKLCLRLLFALCHYRCVSWWSSLRTRVFGCPLLSPVFFPVPCCGCMSASTTLAPGLGWSMVPYPRSFRMVLEPLSEAPLSALQPPALSFLVVLAVGACLQGYWISPLFFPDRRYNSWATCSALPPVCRLSFVLGDVSFWLGFGLCLMILCAPCGCRHTYCGPHCCRECARVLASLVGYSPSGVRHISRVCSSV